MIENPLCYLGLPENLNAIDNVDATRVQRLPECDGDLFVSTTLQALFSSERELKPSASSDGRWVARNAQCPPEHLDVAGDPAHVLASKAHSDTHDHLVGIVVGHLHLKARHLGVGDVQRRRVEPANTRNCY